MEYKTYPCEVKFKYLVRRGLPVVAGFFSEKDALDYALSIGGAVIKANGNPVVPGGFQNSLTVRKTLSGNGSPRASLCAALPKNLDAL